MSTITETNATPTNFSTPNGKTTSELESKKSDEDHNISRSLSPEKADKLSNAGQSIHNTIIRSSTPRSSGGNVDVTKTRPRLISQISDERRSTPLKHRSMHPAEQKRRIVQHTLPPQSRFIIPASEMATTYRKGPHSFNALRRLSRADFSSIRRAGRKMRNLQYKPIFTKFARYTTIHGISHAELATEPKWRRFWYAVFAMCFTVLCIQIFYLILKYFTYPKSVDLDLKFENAPFPSVTICNLNPYKASTLGNIGSIKSTMDAFKNIIDSTGRSEGIAAAIAASKGSQRKRHTRTQRTIRQKNTKAVPTKTANSTNIQRRYLQVYAQCYCEINRLSGERKRGSCFAAYKGKISLTFDDKSQLYNFHATKCLCQLDWITKTIWPCFPYNTWKEHICTECNEQLGHCPMRFHPDVKKVRKLPEEYDICLCHRDYNHCVENNENGEIPEIIPSFDPNELNFTQSFIEIPESLSNVLSGTEIPTTTQAPEVSQALGFEELKDEIAINAKARENLMFAVEGKPLVEKIQLSQPKDELILKCSFNQRDCDIKKDFKLYYDPTYGNCYTFNWNRTEPVTAHRAGANYGLRVMLYANVSEYLPTTEAVGFRITIHDKWIVPFPDAFGHTAPTGFMSSFGVRMKQFIRIEPPHGRCKEGGEDEDSYIYKGYHYSIEGCHRSCTQNEIIHKCGCADPMFPTPKNAIVCKVSDPVARECIKNTTRNIGEMIAKGELENCNCHQPCKETGYEVSYSPARWPSGTTKLLECDINDDLCIEKYRKNAAMIQVFYEELNYETLIESPAYTFSSLLADLGGVSGLWIGISVVSVVEVVQLLNYFLQAYFKRRKLSTNSSHKISAHNYTSSLSSSNTQLYRPKKLSNPSIKSMAKSSLKSLILDETKQIIEEEEENTLSESTLSEPIRKNTYPYLPPGAELPCTCLYESRGTIVFMKPLCPLHGYMVRRSTAFIDYSQPDDVTYESDSKSVGEESITEQEEKILKELAVEELERQNSEIRQNENGKSREVKVQAFG